MSGNTQFAWFTDADNTLWDTDGVFRSAQLRLLEGVEAIGLLPCTEVDRSAFVRKLDQCIAHKHHRGLRYPVEMLISGLAYALRKNKIDNAIDVALSGRNVLSEVQTRSLAEAFNNDLKMTPKLRDGVAAGIQALVERSIPITVVTEGSKPRIESLLELYQLRASMADVVEATKTAALFRRLRRRHPQKKCWMIGDQADRDIEFALQGGMQGVLFLGGFLPHWTKEAPIDVHSVSRYDAGVQKMLSHCASQQLNYLESLFDPRGR